MTFSVVDAGAAGYGGQGGVKILDPTFSYINLSPGDLICMVSIGHQGLASWSINGNTASSLGKYYVANASTPVPGVTARMEVVRVFSEPASGTLQATHSGNANIGGASYFIIHDSEGFPGSTSDVIGIDIGALVEFAYQNNAGPLSGSHLLSTASRSPGFGGEQVQLAVGFAWDYRPAGGTVTPSVFSSPSGTSVQSSSQFPTIADYATAVGGWDIGAAGTVPSRSSTGTWSEPSAGGSFPNNVGLEYALVAPVIYLAQRHHVTMHKTIVPNGDGYDGPADPTTQFLANAYDNTPSGFPGFGPLALWLSAADGDDMRIPDNSLYTGGTGVDNAGAAWNGFESYSGIETVDYVISDITGDGGNVAVTWTSGNFFDLQVSGDGDLYFENTYTGTTPVVPTGDYWGIQSADY